MEWTEEDMLSAQRAAERVTGEEIPVEVVDDARAVFRAVMTRAVELMTARSGTMPAKVDLAVVSIGNNYSKLHAESLREYIAAQGARVAVLEAERETLRVEIRTLRGVDLAEARATIAHLTASGQALSEHANKAGGPTPGQCICGGDEHHTFHCPANHSPEKP